MYQLKAALPETEGLGDLIIDELAALFESYGQDCTCAIANGAILGYVEDDMSARVTKILLRHLPKVEAQVAVDEDELALA